MGAQAVRLSNVDIDNALKNKDFEVIFQPVFDLGNGALARVETFVRWRHPALGVLPPGAFISFFESQGRMSELTRYVLGEALDAYLSWRGPYAPGFSINLALSDLTDEAFASHFVKLMRDREFPADLVTLECPMPPVDQDLKSAAAQFERLASTGARLAIEVRGRANDFLRGIDPFPFQEIKTGGSAILRFARTVRGPGLSAIADLLDIANKSNAAITAVGVEDQASLSALRGLGFTAAQGNHLAKVGALSEFMPGHVNDVRGLLGLEPLEKNELAALFRTESPSLPSSVQSAPEKISAEKSDDALLERLNSRVSQQKSKSKAQASDDKAKTSDQQAANPAAPTAKALSDDDRKLRARAKAKALVLAKRAKAREALKAAAIERAKLKSVASDSAGEYQEEAARSSTGEPRAMQERISREFAYGEEQPHAKATSTDAEKPLTADRTKRQSAPEAAQPETTSENPAIQYSSDAHAKLHIEKSAAYFQPGIRVGNPQLSPSKTIAPRTEIPMPADTSSESAIGKNLKARRATTPEQAPTDLTPDTADIIQGDLLSDPSDTDSAHEPNQSQQKRRAKKSKPFLKRTVIAYPKYFWPKGLRRRFRKMKSGDDRPLSSSAAAESNQ